MSGWLDNAPSGPVNKLLHTVCKTKLCVCVWGWDCGNASVAQGRAVGIWAVVPMLVVGSWQIVAALMRGRAKAVIVFSRGQPSTVRSSAGQPLSRGLLHPVSLHPALWLKWERYRIARTLEDLARTTVLVVEGRIEPLVWEGLEYGPCNTWCTTPVEFQQRIDLSGDTPGTEPINSEPGMNRVSR